MVQVRKVRHKICLWVEAKMSINFRFPAEYFRREVQLGRKREKNPYFRKNVKNVFVLCLCFYENLWKCCKNEKLWLRNKKKPGIIQPDIGKFIKAVSPTMSLFFVHWIGKFSASINENIFWKHDTWFRFIVYPEIYISIKSAKPKMEKKKSNRSKYENIFIEIFH